MTTPTKTHARVPFAALLQRARLDYCSRTLTDAHASAEHVTEARRVLATEGTTGSVSSVSMTSMIKTLPTHLMLEFRAVCKRIDEHMRATEAETK